MLHATLPCVCLLCALTQRVALRCQDGPGGPGGMHPSQEDQLAMMGQQGSGPHGDGQWGGGYAPGQHSTTQKTITTQVGHAGRLTGRTCDIMPWDQLGKARGNP